MIVQLKLQQTDLLVQETTAGVVIFRNDTQSKATIPDPGFSDTCPVLRVTDLQTGKSLQYALNTRVRTYDPEFTPQITPPPVMHLNPGEVHELPFGLLAWVRTMTPGRYTLQAIVDSKLLQAASAPVELTVRPMSAGWVHAQASAADGDDAWHTGWTNLDDGGATVLLRTDSITRFVTAEQSVRIGQVKKPVWPVISVPPNQFFEQGHWVAWLDGADLYTAYASEGRLIHAPRRLGVGGQDLRLVSPLLHGVAVDQPPADGYAFVWQMEAAGGRMLFVHIRADGKAAVEHAIAGGNVPPVWSQATYSSKQLRRVLWMGKADDEIRLYAATWPADRAPAPAALLGTHKGTFIAADATMDEKDLTQGATLALTNVGPGRVAVPKIFRWQLDASGQWQDRGAIDVSWPPDSGISEARLRLTRHGQPWALVRDARRVWHWVDPEGKVTAMHGEPSLADNVEIVFGEGDAPLARCPNDRLGFRYVHRDGQLLPVW